MRASLPNHGTCANSASPKAGPSKPRNGAINFVIVRKINEIFPDDTVKSLASWLKLTWKTAKNRMQCEREFSLDEVAELLASDHGFKILTAIMRAAEQRPGYRAPAWWRVCEPLMDLADTERMRLAVRKRVAKAIEGHHHAEDEIERDIGRAQAMAVQIGRASC